MRNDTVSPAPVRLKTSPAFRVSTNKKSPNAVSRAGHSSSMCQTQGRGVTYRFCLSSLPSEAVAGGRSRSVSHPLELEDSEGILAVVQQTAGS